MSMFTLISVLVASTLAVVSGFLMVRGKNVHLLLPFLCGVAYVVLSVDWLATGQGDRVGALRDVAWNLVEIGYMVVLLSYIIRDPQN